jgi:hypothetical protein
MKGKPIVLHDEELSGSRLRCLLATSLPDAIVADWLSRMVAPHATVDAKDQWMPRGLKAADEAKLGETSGFLTDAQRETITAWWLKQRGGANTPNWDIVSTCEVEGKRGLILVEAKAHTGELGKGGKSKGNAENDAQIQTAIEEANTDLNRVSPDWNLSRDNHYQLCNRFAWSWKLAEMGVPVILVTLGFLNAHEMSHRGQPFLSADEWRAAVHCHAQNIVPQTAWETKLDINGTPLIPLIRSADITLGVLPPAAAPSS